MYYIIDIDTFTVLRGPFLDFERVKKILDTLSNPNAYIVMTV